LKLFNLNIGIKIDNNKEVIDLISKGKYDIITLQESMRKVDTFAFDMYDSSNIIKNKLNFKNNFFGPVWVAKNHIKNGNISKDFGGLVEQGNQILTNLPLVKSRNIFYYKDYSIFEDTTNFRLYDHPRAFTDSLVKINNQELQIINVHGCWNKDKKGNDRTQLQTEFILKNIRNDIPCIVVGDFNLLPETDEIKLLSKNLNNLIAQYNIKSTRPDFDDGLDTGNMVCDYIFVNDKVKVNDFYVLDSSISDHFPLVLDFDVIN